MKNICLQMTRRALAAFVMVLALALPSFAQNITVTGTVYEPEGEPAIGASVEVKGSAGFGVVTDFDGKFTIKVAPTATLVISYVGCDTQEIPVDNRTDITVNLKTNTVSMSELVVVGYGTVKKTDATGSLGVVKPSDIEAGLASTAQDLLVGASPGVVVNTNGGDPSGAANITIRGGASLNATTAPLIVIDGVPMDNKGVTGSSNPLSLVNPENIETISILKSASATAIYGSRASNGVIIITTKTGKSGKPQVNFAANFFVNTPRNYLDMMNAGQFRNYIREHYGEESAQYQCLGSANTDWQKEVTRTSFSHDYTLSVGGTAGILPYRVAVGYTGNNGIMRHTGMDRVTGSINLTPKFFDNLLSVNANVKGAYVRNEYEPGVLGGAVYFNPTLPVKTDAPAFNGWTTYIGGGGIAQGSTPGSAINTLMTVNPRSRLDDYVSKSNVYQSVGNIQLDLKMPFLSELRANLNLGYDYSHGESWNYDKPFSPQAWLGSFTVLPEDGGAPVTYKNGFTNRNKSNDENLSTMLEFYLNYNKTFDAIHSDLDVTAGYSWQRFSNKGRSFSRVVDEIASVTGQDFIDHNFAIPDGFADADAYAEFMRQFAGYQYADTYHYARRYQLVSFFGRLNYAFKGRYLLTATVRRDGTSRFAKENRWGTYPAVAVGWRIIDENFMEGARSWMNDLKLRFDYGITGQQGLNDDFFPYLPTYYTSTNLNGRYPLADGTWVFPYTPNKYNADLKWESTTTYNVGIDFGFLNNRINGSIEYYVRKTKDLLVEANYPAGSNLSNVGIINGGDLENSGFEFNINTKPVVTNDFIWTSNLNIAYNRNKITRLADGYDGSVGDIGDAIRVQKHVVGQPAYSFYVYEQVYNADGTPLEGVYVDQNGDGIINKEDLIQYHSPTPTVTATWVNNFQYKNWDLGFTLRGNFDNWVYNNTESGGVFPNTALAATPVSNIRADRYLFQSSRTEEMRLSNYFVQNASFVRCDNITLGYTWQNLLQNKLKLRLYAAVQNPFVITKYKGLDPEVTFSNGIDNNPYPRPVQVSLGVVANF